MAKMIPPYISPDVKSGAERKIYAAIKDSGMQGAVCLHSLGLSRHLSKRQGEIDFVLVTDDSIYCLEVKGGRITRRDGVWYFMDRYGQEGKKAEGPFSQASSAMYSLKSNLEAKFGHTGFLFGYGVVMPDINFDVDSPEWDQKTVYDLRDAGKPFENFFRRLQAYWHGKVGEPSPRVAKEDIVKYLRGDFELLTPLWKQIQDIEGQVAGFTTEQYRALDQMESNPRVIFSGGAGTGKTLLAVEKARRAAFNGKRVLLLCYNKFLGSKLQGEIAHIESGGTLIWADSIHKYFAKTIKDAGLKHMLDRQPSRMGERELYDQVFSDLFIQSVKKAGYQKFDTLIIDEGQDLLSDAYLLALDAVLEQGLEKGEWAVFLDPGAQARLFNKFSRKTYEYLKSLGAPEYKLDVNCRNTEQIAAQASIVSGFPTGRALVAGPKVEYFHYSDDAEQAAQVVGLVKRLVVEEKVPAECITILSTRAKDSMSLLSSGAKLPGFFAEMDEKNINEPTKGTVYYASVQAYKGLENNVIVYTDVDRIDDKWIEAVNYVGMTRPREKLYVFLHKKQAKKFDVRLMEYATHKQTNA